MGSPSAKAGEVCRIHEPNPGGRVQCDLDHIVGVELELRVKEFHLCFCAFFPEMGCPPLARGVSRANAPVKKQRCRSKEDPESLPLQVANTSVHLHGDRGSVVSQPSSMKRLNFAEWRGAREHQAQGSILIA